MSAKPDKQSYEAQLSSLESRLTSPEHDEAMLGEVGLAIRNLLSSNGESEAHIRQILERQFEQGNLRQESYELVEKLLTKVVAERRVQPAQPENAEAAYVDTDVLEQPEPPEAPATVTETLQVGSVLRDRYLLKEKVSDGGMGTVYKAMDRRLAEAGEKGAFVAIKVLSPKLSRNGAALRALQQEAAKGRCLSHPNIVRFIDIDREDDLFFMVMEWLDGRSLAKILDESRGDLVDFGTATGIIAQVSRALSYAHQRGVVHADVKPGNIIITPEGHVKLIDFGVARVRQKENEGKSRFDPDVMRAGTPAYSSMQVLTGEDPTPADDVFSLACLLYRLVAGYRVFGPRNAADAAQEGMEPQQPQEFNSDQWQAVRKALSYSRVMRFQSIKEFMDAFGALPDRPVKPALKSKPAVRDSAESADLQATAPTAGVTPNPPAEPQVQAVPAHADRPIIGPDETTHVSVDVPMRAERDSIMYSGDENDDEAPRRSPLRLLVVGTIFVASVVVVLRPDIVETLDLDASIASITEYFDEVTGTGGDAGTAPVAANPTEIESLEPVPESEIADTATADIRDSVIEEIVIDAASGNVTSVTTESGNESSDSPAVVDEAPVSDVPLPDPLPEPIDFSVLPEPTLLLTIGNGEDGQIASGSVTVREDGGAAIIDLVREGDLAEAFEVQFVETRFSGNRSSWESGLYEIRNNGTVVFDRGQPRARTLITMRSNPVREPDREVTLVVRDAATRSIDLATIDLTLEDDDQRAFEASLPPNTVGFAVNQISVREFDPAVQVDVVRYRADNTALEVGFTLTDVTATEGQDYFAPSLPSVYFGPGERTARILIPLGQDSRVEQDEAFMLALDDTGAAANSNIFKQIAVMIRDDDS